MTTSRSQFHFVIGQYVSHDDDHYRVVEFVDFDSVIGTNLETGRTEVLSFKKIKSIKGAPDKKIDIESISDKHWKRAHERWDAIKPLVNCRPTKEEVKERAKEVNKNHTTLYRWIKKYNDAGSFEGLLPGSPGVDKGTKKLSVEVERILEDAIENIYLTTQREPVKKVVDEIDRQCKALGLPDKPHPNTIRSRINSIAPYERMKKRGMKKAAYQKYGAAPGHFPDIEAPLDCVQIDHTPVDVMLVDDEYRLPIGRPHLTMAIDLYSRMCTGYYLSLDAPSALSDAMCVAHSVLKKDKWLALHGVNAEWPAFGLMKMIHTDNGSDFKSETFSNACMMHGIEIQNRPKNGPQYGGHIERLLKTKMKEVHSLPGTTFHNVQEKGEYDSEKTACMSFDEFEKWLVKVIDIYNSSKHSEIFMTPLRKWEIGIFGDANNPGFGLPPLPDNPETFLLDFMPMFKRTVQRTGIKIDGLTYFDDVLRSWIRAEDEEHTGKARKFICRRDPRDISFITFYDPKIQDYFRIDLTNPKFKGMSLWEFKEAKSRLKADGDAHYDEDAILEKLAQLREDVKESAKKTKSARMKQQKQKNREKMITPVDPKPTQNLSDEVKQSTSNTSDKKNKSSDELDFLDKLLMEDDDDMVDVDSLSPFEDMA